MPSSASYWLDNTRRQQYAAIDRDISVDAVVVGAGMTGITTAYLLKKSGLSVAIVERGQWAGGDTSHTSAHLTAVTDQRLSELVGRFGRDHAQAVWDAGFAALSQIETIVRHEGINCDFRWVPAHLHSRLSGDDDPKEIDELRREAELAADLGFDAVFVDRVHGLERPAIRFEGQAKFHPLRYLSGVLDTIPGRGSHVFEHSEVTEIRDNPLSVIVGPHTISTGFVVIATHVPLVGKSSLLRAALLEADLYPYSSYVVGARIARGRMPEVLSWDSSDPYFYLRVDPHEDHDFVVFGGCDHKTGQAADTRENFAQVERALVDILPDAKVTHRWSGQVIHTRDGLPYIGETSPRQFAATGFFGNGITFGTVAALMTRDAATRQLNPWKMLFDIQRTGVTRGLWNYLKENKDYPYYMIRDRFAGVEGKSTRVVARGQGKILELEGSRVAVYRHSDGTVTKLSPICTHLGCRVAWNHAEKTWDCPCHGSRFSAEGQVIAGPAERPLERA